MATGKLAIKFTVRDKAFKDFTKHVTKNIGKSLDAAKADIANMAVMLAPAIIKGHIRMAYDNPRLGEFMASQTDVAVVATGASATFVVTGKSGAWRFHELGSTSRATGKVIVFEKDKGGGKKATGKKGQAGSKGREASSYTRNVGRVFASVELSEQLIESELTQALVEAVSDSVRSVLNKAGGNVKVDRSATSRLNKAGYSKNDLSRLGISSVTKDKNGKYSYRSSKGIFLSGPVNLNKTSKKRRLK